MTTKAVFQGLVFDDNDQILSIAFVGAEACYVIDDDGFRAMAYLTYNIFNGFADSSAIQKTLSLMVS